MKIKLRNIINGRSALCRVNMPGYAACYADHEDLMKWARKTGCARALHALWHGETVEPFIEAVVSTACGFAVYRNRPEYFSAHGKWDHFHRSYVEQNDELAFFAEETDI